MKEKALNSLIQLALKNQAQDIHLRPNAPPFFRLKGELQALDAPPLSQGDLQELAQALGAKTLGLEFEGAYHPPQGDGHVRFSGLRYKDGLGLVLRPITRNIPTLEELFIDPQLAILTQAPRGLILVTGESGAGKSSTLAALINIINQKHSRHIITIEDPIEYCYPRLKAQVTQREVGIHTKDFQTGLRSALRQDPDVILVGEIRDSHTATMALSASETGHLVFSTLHTTNSMATIGRFLSFFPPADREEAAFRLANNLYASITQRLIPANTPSGLIPAQEILINSPGIQECIVGQQDRRNIRKILAQGYRGQAPRTQTFDQHIIELYSNKMITKEASLRASCSPIDFSKKMDIEEDDDFL